MQRYKPDREKAFALLLRYNTAPFHILHALWLEGVMRHFAQIYDPGLQDFWGIVGLLHDVDYEQYPTQHCLQAPVLLQEIGADEALIHAVCSHGYGICCNVEPVLFMEKILYSVDELTGLIGAAVKMRPSKSVQDLEVKSLKKKFKDKKFAAGCDRGVIEAGAKMLGWTLDELLEQTILAMRDCESEVLRLYALYDR